MSSTDPVDRSRSWGGRFPKISLLAPVIAALVIWLAFGVFPRASFTVGEACGNAPGQITITASSAFSPLTYTWSRPSDMTWTPPSPGAATQTGLERGTYKVVIENSIGLKRTLLIPLGGLQDVSVVATAPTGFLTTDGSLSVNVTPVGETCAYAWDDGTKTKDRSRLNAGVYTVNVTDATKPTCILTRSEKLLPVYSTACVDWASRNPLVLTSFQWTLPDPKMPAFFFHRLRVKALLPPPAADSLVLKGCLDNTFLAYDQEVPLLEYVAIHKGAGGVAERWNYPGPILNPVASTLPINDLAAELLVALLNIRNVKQQPSPPKVPMEDAVYLGNPYYGYTVQRIVRMAERALDCGKDESDNPLSPQGFAKLLDALEKINDGGFFLACPAP